MTVEEQDTRYPPKASLGFNGELFESWTGHCLLGNGYRAYSPVLMIFIQPDSWSPFGAGGLNAYAYCKGDPVNAADPTGHMPFKQLLQFGRVNRFPSPTPQDLPPVLPVLSEADLVPTLGGRVSPVPVWPPERFSPPHILADTAPAVSQSSSALPTSARSVGPSGVVLGSNTRNVNYPYIETEISRMISSNDAAGIIALAKQRFKRIPVLRELHQQLPLTPDERRNAYSRRGQSPTIPQKHLQSLTYRALREGLQEKAQFYDRLRRGLTVKIPKKRPRTR